MGTLNGTAVLWNAANGEQLHLLSHEGLVLGAAWNADESQVLTWSYDGTAKLWDAHTGQPLLIINPDGTPINDAQWNQDEDRLLIASDGGIVRMYKTNMAELINAACLVTTRNLTWTEWQLYFPGQPYRLICPQWPVHDSVPESERTTP